MLTLLVILLTRPPEAQERMMTANDDIPVMVLITINLRFFQLSHHYKQNRMTLCSDVSQVDPPIVFYCLNLK